MIRWSATGLGGRKVIGLGIEEGNIERLKDGKPILVTGEALGFAGDIFITYGEDKAALLKQFRDAGIELPTVIETNLGCKQ